MGGIYGRLGEKCEEKGAAERRYCGLTATPYLHLPELPGTGKEIDDSGMKD